MSDAVAVAEAERGDELLEIFSRGGLREPPAACDFGVEFAALGELHNEVDLGFRCHDFVDFQDVGVVLEALHGGDFSGDQISDGRFRPVDDFDRDWSAVSDRMRSVNLGEAAFSKQPIQLILAEDDCRRR
ncbi:hypothetical protein QQ045_022041 [Rhodiola kirilowii]